MSLGSDFALTDIFPCGFPSFLPLGTLFSPSLSFSISHKCLDRLLPKDVLVLLPISWHFPKPQPRFYSYELSLSSPLHPLPNTRLFHQKGSGPTPATFMTMFISFHLLYEACWNLTEAWVSWDSPEIARQRVSSWLQVPDIPNPAGTCSSHINTYILYFKKKDTLNSHFPLL